jgi:hypothetical protein
VKRIRAEGFAVRRADSDPDPLDDPMRLWLASLAVPVHSKRAINHALPSSAMR